MGTDIDTIYISGEWVTSMSTSRIEIQSWVMSSLQSSSASACGAGTMPDLHRAMWNRPWTCNAMQH